ncbi:hypothetical protein G2912_33065 [Paraburkholderia aspalathi]|nr:hypothetical protein [Paraburkholderia aspalathi]
MALADPIVALSTGARNLAIRPLVTEVAMEYGFLYPIGRTRPPAVRALADAIRKVGQDRITGLGIQQAANRIR